MSVAAATSTTTTGIPGSPTTTSRPRDTPRSAFPGCRQPAAPEGRRTRRARTSRTSTRRSAASSTSTTTSVQRRRLPHAEGRASASGTRPTTSTRRIPAATSLFWNPRSPAASRRRPGTGTYGYYEVNDRGTAGKTGANIHSCTSRTRGAQQPPDPEPRRPHREGRRSPPSATDIQNAFDFGFGDKIAPRLGVSSTCWATAG